MWLLTTFGFFSVVEKPGDREADALTVRARVKADLEHLRAKYLPGLGEISESSTTDYRYRAQASKPQVMKAFAAIAKDIDYSNFKSAVGNRMGSARAKTYGKVWDVLYALQEGNEQEKQPAPARTHPSAITQISVTNSFGGVLVDDSGRVLLREPSNHYDGYVWTFAKGKADRGATPEQTALREVLEETGYDAEIVAKIPGGYRGGTGTTEYFLMRPIGPPGKFQASETAKIKWVSFEDAEGLISLTRNNLGRQRDLKVLQAAQALSGRLATKS